MLTIACKPHKMSPNNITDCLGYQAGRREYTTCDIKRMMDFIEDNENYMLLESNARYARKSSLV